MNAKIGMQIIGTAKQSVKEHRSSKSPIIRLLVSILYVLWNTAKTAIRVCVDTDFRSILLLQLLNSKNVHQTTPLTYMDRYPTIFSACRDYFDGKQDLKILSYGCSTGEEVLTLRRYFPTAHIIGAEINKRSLAICRKLPVDEKITFLYSTISEIQKYGHFDAIFCMAVLQRKPHYIAAKGISSLKKIYPFEKFERQIIELDELINPQGLLVVHSTQYSLCDTNVASKYEALGSHNQNDYLLPVFDKNSNLVKNPTSQNTIFIKLHK
ncbi:class I SAM-dependent methyltransferase [Paenibacillus sp. GP183]|uniref:class I SAM-dependent methyltransferase n=1 Tax=Paenibacillus sp. GP183 TaxID=1882751 RepID=UPI0008945A05|nr:class I SAM-dependent methyltransferase [Paenibacillus sp. GP183]SEC08196.1 Methyltransferase domain-containing protein [Paenibacillus sp. GP183]